MSTDPSVALTQDYNVADLSLADWGRKEIAIAETEMPGLMSVRKEFAAQVQRHEELIQRLFGHRPTVFRNTELTYDNALAEYISGLGRYDAVLCEGVDRLLDYRSPNDVERAP